MNEQMREQLEKLTYSVESYMIDWSSKDSYNDFRLLLNIYLTLCDAVKKEPEETLSLDYKLEAWIIGKKE